MRRSGRAAPDTAPTKRFTRVAQPRILRPAHRSKLASGPGIAAPDDGHALLEADQRFQAALDQAIAKGRERIEAVEATVQLKRHTKLSL
jgi:hypothetical protein